jgi:hypothetical protein
VARSGEVVSHWNLLVDNFNTSALAFYDAVEASLRERQIPEIRTERIEWKQGGVLSANRIYLRVIRGRLVYDICAAPYGTGYFFSSWHSVQPPEFAMLFGVAILLSAPFLLMSLIGGAGIIQGTFMFVVLVAAGLGAARGIAEVSAAEWEETVIAMPVIGRLYSRLFKPTTYYSIDTRLMFQASVHRAVVETIEGLRNAQGLRALSPNELQQDMKALTG